MTAETPPRRTWRFDALIATFIVAIELFATWDSADSDGFAPVDEWAATRDIDALAYFAVVVGCAALFWRRRYPVATLLVSGGAFILFMLRDYELGLFLPVIVMVYTAASLGASRLWTILVAAGSMAVSLWWVAERVAPVSDDGTITLAWVAFGTVFAWFYLGPLLVGELVHSRRQHPELELPQDQNQ